MERVRDGGARDGGGKENLKIRKEKDKFWRGKERGKWVNRMRKAVARATSTYSYGRYGLGESVSQIVRGASPILQTWGRRGEDGGESYYSGLDEGGHETQHRLGKGGGYSPAPKKGYRRVWPSVSSKKTSTST